jgi:hypothetical protein
MYSHTCITQMMVLQRKSRMIEDETLHAIYMYLGVDAHIRGRRRPSFFLGRCLQANRKQNKTKHTGLPFFRAFCKIPRLTGLQTEQSTVYRVLAYPWLVVCGRCFLVYQCVYV